jgi:hypothetical protein
MKGSSSKIPTKNTSPAGIDSKPNTPYQGRGGNMQVLVCKLIYCFKEKNEKAKRKCWGNGQ